MCERCETTFDLANHIRKGYFYCPFCGRNLGISGKEIVIEFDGDEDAQFYEGGHFYGDHIIKIFCNVDTVKEFFECLEIRPKKGKEYVEKNYRRYMDLALIYMNTTKNKLEHISVNHPELFDCISSSRISSFRAGGNQTLEIDMRSFM